LSDEAITMKRRAAVATIFSRVCAEPPPFTSQPSGSDLICAVDRDVEPPRFFERLDDNAECASCGFGRRRRRRAADREPSRSERR